MATHREVVNRPTFMALRDMIGGNPRTAKAIIAARGNLEPEEFSLSQVHIPPYRGDVVIDWDDNHGDGRVRLDSLPTGAKFRMFHYPDAAVWETVRTAPFRAVRIRTTTEDGDTAELEEAGARMVYPV